MTCVSFASPLPYEPVLAPFYGLEAIKQHKLALFPVKSAKRARRARPDLSVGKGNREKRAKAAKSGKGAEKGGYEAS